MRAAGYEFTGNWRVGENIVFRSIAAPSSPVGPTVGLEYQDLFVDAGITGRDHRVNILAEGFREMGVGVNLGVFTSSGNDYNIVMVTQDFGATDANRGPFLVGVVYRDADGDSFYTSGEGVAGVTVIPAGGGDYAVTSTSGGYAIPVGDLKGTVTIRFSGGGLAAPISRSAALEPGLNVKLALDLLADPSVFGFVPGSARFSGSQFETELSGPANLRLGIEVSSDLNVWSSLQDVTLSSGNAHFIDSQTASATHRYYRAVKR